MSSYDLNKMKKSKKNKRVWQKPVWQIVSTTVASDATVSVGTHDDPLRGAKADLLIIDDPGPYKIRTEYELAFPLSQILDTIDSYVCETMEEQDAVDNIILHVRSSIKGGPDTPIARIPAGSKWYERQ